MFIFHLGAKIVAIAFNGCIGVLKNYCQSPRYFRECLDTRPRRLRH